MNRTRAILIADGEAKRWGNYMNIPKHLVKIEGEPIIHRAVRLLNERNVRDVHVVGPNDDRYRIEGSQLYRAKKNPKNFDADKFLNSAPLWNLEGRTIVLYGDVFFTEAAMDTIVFSQTEDWRLFCRFDASQLTGTPYGECFAQSFYPKDIDRHREKLLYIAKLKGANTIQRCGGWEHYRAMQGLKGRDVGLHQRLPGRVEIDDWTDDFDSRQDYDRWMANWEEAKKKGTISS